MMRYSQETQQIGDVQYMLINYWPKSNVGTFILVAINQYWLD